MKVDRAHTQFIVMIVATCQYSFRVSFPAHGIATTKLGCLRARTLACMQMQQR
jgi:hypothetical protein